MHASGFAWERMTAYAAMVVSSLFAVQTSYHSVIILQAMTQGRSIGGTARRHLQDVRAVL